MRLILGILLVCAPCFAGGEGPPKCALADTSVLEASVQLGTMHGLTHEQREEVREYVVAHLEDLLPFLLVVGPDDQPHLRIELSTDNTFILDRLEEPPEGEGYKIVEENPRAEVTFTRFTCQGHPSEYKNCADRVRVADRLPPEEAEMAIDDPSALSRYYVETVSRKICEMFGTAPN